MPEHYGAGAVGRDGNVIDSAGNVNTSVVAPEKPVRDYNLYVHQCSSEQRHVAGLMLAAPWAKRKMQR
jgi:hypothetical protein